MKSKLNIFITGIGGPAGSGCLQILKESTNHNLIGADSNQYANTGNSRVKKFYTLPMAYDKNYIPELKKILIKEKIDVCFPTVDEELVVIANNIHEFEKLDARFPIDDQRNNAYSDDKFLFYDFLEKHNLPYPKTFLVRNKYDLDKAFEKVGFPAVFKQIVGRGGTGMIFVDNEKQARAMYPGGRILFQEKITGRVYLVSALFDFKSNLLASICHIRTVEETGNLGSAKSAISINDKKVLDLGLTALRKMNAKGLHALELMGTDDGRVLFLENNPRLAGQCYLSYKAGVNLPKMAIDYLMGKDIIPVTSFKEGIRSQRIFYDVV